MMACRDLDLFESRGLEPGLDAVLEHDGDIQLTRTYIETETGGLEFSESDGDDTGGVTTTTTIRRLVLPVAPGNQSRAPADTDSFSVPSTLPEDMVGQSSSPGPMPLPHAPTTNTSNPSLVCLKDSKSSPLPPKTIVS